MSRGLGRLQRAIIARLQSERARDPFAWVSTYELAQLQATPAREPMRSELEATRRAVRTLHGRGLIDTRREVVEYLKRERWRWRSMILARLPLSPAERAVEKAAEDARKATRAERLRELERLLG